MANNYANYMSICSERTLQSNTKGFFMQFADLVCENAGSEWVKNDFGSLKTDAERIRMIYEDPQVNENICNTLSCVQEIFRKKSAEVSQARRKEAEKCYQEGQNQKSLILYSQSVLRAPPNGTSKLIDDGKSLSFALWGRSESLMALNEFSFALRDLQLALKESIPSHFKGVAFWKMAICYKAIGELEKANVSFGLAQKLLEDEPKQLKAIKADMSREFVENKRNTRKVLPNISGKKNKSLPTANKKLSIKESKELGRYVVANETIKTGETLVVEAPYVACLLPEYFGTHCHHCFERLVAPVGCPDCSNIAFCKMECRDAAVDTYHKFECKFLDLLIGSGMSILSHTALRMVTQNSLQKSLVIHKDRSKEKVYSMCTNAEQRKPEDFLQRTLMAAFLLRCLQKGGYFNDQGNQITPSEDEYNIGELLLFHLQMLQFNAHEIYETNHLSDHRFRKAKACYIGVAIYPTASLFNHDCYPAVNRYFVGKNIVINASRPFGSGEMIPENYGPMFIRKPLVERQKLLEGRYWFKCKCIACSLDWPSLDTGLDKISKRVRCPSKDCIYIFTLPVSSDKLRCPRCKKMVSLAENILGLKRCEDQYQEAFAMMDLQQTEEGIKILCDAIDGFHRVSCPPHSGTHLAQEMLRAFVADSGNVHEVLITK